MRGFADFLQGLTPKERARARELMDALLAELPVGEIDLTVPNEFDMSSGTLLVRQGDVVFAWREGSSWKMTALGGGVVETVQFKNQAVIESAIGRPEDFGNL